MNIIDGNRDYLKVEDDFIKLYNNWELTVKEVQTRLGLTKSEYRKLRKKCNEDGTIELRPAYRPQKQKQEPKYYSVAHRGRYYDYYQIQHKREHYCTCKSVKEAELVVERLKACEWDKSQVERIKKEVKELMRNGS